MQFVLTGLVAGGLLLSGCSQVRGHQGYIVDPVLTNAIQPGVDNRQSVEASLGRPTFTGQFDENTWYYVSRETKQLAFNSPTPRDQMVMRINFDQAGNVTAVERTGLELVASISPEGDTTPTLGRERSFFQELFGNIGAVGAPGAQGRSNDPTRP
ncbi:outer membrane protein assembly factor BamE [Parasphingorhabdus cellanae]|uniref:Outer membrane protein assembly factor BamE n=2 Tax=Parasphingorhabdus cellanae TaxID=2806553 RepID=A0ABX7TB27_9SPHN|nr:outer membrane protein assembly factor BamE [Parasphingorhabdus cellanae]QTD57777.1 outer membrane protein assembly factor BamE [Parasphingorhabdus cellanae]